MVAPSGTTFQPVSRRKPKKTGVLCCAGTIFGTAFINLLTSKYMKLFINIFVSCPSGGTIVFRGLAEIR